MMLVSHLQAAMIRQMPYNDDAKVQRLPMRCSLLLVYAVPIIQLDGRSQQGRPTASNDVHSTR